MKEALLAQLHPEAVAVGSAGSPEQSSLLSADTLHRGAAAVDAMLHRNSPVESGFQAVSRVAGIVICLYSHCTCQGFQLRPTDRDSKLPMSPADDFDQSLLDELYAALESQPQSDLECLGPNSASSGSANCEAMVHHT